MLYIMRHTDSHPPKSLLPPHGEHTTVFIKVSFICVARCRLHIALILCVSCYLVHIVHLPEFVLLAAPKRHNMKRMSASPSEE